MRLFYMYIIMRLIFYLLLFIFYADEIVAKKAREKTQPQHIGPDQKLGLLYLCPIESGPSLAQKILIQAIADHWPTKFALLRMS